MFAEVLGLKSAVEELRFRLYPSVYHSFDSEELSRSLKRDSTLHLGQSIGIADYRDLQSAFINKHRDPGRLPIFTPDSAEDLQQGHSSSTAREYYALTPEDPHGTSNDTIKAYRRSSSWWQHITGKQPLSLAGLVCI